MDPIDPKSLREAADPKNLADYLAGLPSEGMAMHAMHGAGGHAESVREDDYQGHHIVVRTTYRFEVDGHVLEVPLTINNDGSIHCHSLPNYQFPSAIGLVRQLIDTYPEEFPGTGARPSRPAPGGPPPHGMRGGN